MRAALAVVALVLAGCSGEPEPEDTTPEPDDAFAAPGAWAVGDWWRIDAGGSSGLRMVTGDEGADWIMDTDNADTAFFDARADVSTLGPQRKSDLAGSQGSDRVKFFQWPLTEGDLWTTPWDGETLHVSVVSIGTVARLEARADDELRVAYTYDPRLRWFGEMRFQGADGEEFTMDVVEAGHNNTVDAVRVSLDVYLDDNVTGPGAGHRSLPDPPASTDLYLDISIRCDEGTLAFGVGPAESAPGAVTGADGPGYAASGTCPLSIDDGVIIAASPYPSQWSTASVVPEGAWIDHTVWARTVTAVPAMAK